MNLYEKQVESELEGWYKGIVKSAGVLERTSDGIQKKTRQLVPRKVQETITAAVKTMTKTMLHGSGLLSIQEDTQGMTLPERDYLVLACFGKYRNIATAQGIGFGAGGILLGMADLPVLMSIKIKFLFDTAKLYGYNPEEPAERLFLLHIFQLAFSGREHRMDIFEKLEGWDESPHSAMDWEKFQTEYRDYLDVAKLLQMLPVVGGVVGGAANHKLMNRLRENVMNSYRMRILKKKFPGLELYRLKKQSRK